MFYFIEKPHTSSFPTEVVKTKSNFIVISAETDLGRRKLVVAVISVDGYLFLVFSDLACDLEITGIGVFWLHSAAWQQGGEPWK